ncbi:MAG TPA: hypothetical protein VGX25_05375 [Actinophytocola sp.]|uniref:hypothetical protein n=1 Tax=Actinophytocola sp. TaxID=1872138 RepID=UPI002DDD328B|nr:hypothetical protein [Actinophytocola sp.]HEV2778813.1 hypothetical protein [Actinophytocola sp.]
MNNEVAIHVKKVDSRAVFTDMRAESKKAGADVGDNLKRGFNDGEQASDKARRQIKKDLDKTADDAKRAGDQIGQGLKDGMADGAGGLGDLLEGTLGGGLDPASLVDGLLGGMSGPMATGGALLGGIVATGILSGVQTTWAEDKVGGLLAAQTGAVGDAAGRLGDIAGNVFSDNFGESIEDIGTSLNAVLQNELIDLKAPQAEIEELTKMAHTAAQVIGEDANNVARAAKQLLVNGLASNAQEALDIIVTASAKAKLNVNGDLIDTIVEYSTKFRDLGLKGPEALGLIQQAMKAGARDTDFAADALKEFSIRAIDGSETTARGFKTIGLDAGRMADAIAGGGKRAHDALDLTLDKLRAIEDPVLRDQAAVDLFGTKAEDLGDSLFAMDLDTVAEDFGKVEGATAGAADAIDEATPKHEKAWRSFTGVLGDAADGLLSMVEYGTPLGLMNEDLNTSLETGATKFGDWAGAADEATGSLERQVKTLDELIAANSELAGGVLDLSEAQIRHQEALDEAAESIAKNGKNLDISTEKGRENRSALDDVVKSTYDVIEAMENQGATSQEVQGFVASQREEFIRLATQMGMDATAAQTMADKLGLIPGNYTATVSADTSGAHDTLSRLRDDLQRLVQKRYELQVKAFVAGLFGGGYAHGGIVGAGHAAEGGPRSNQVLVGERGPEIVDLAPGSTVHSSPDSERMMASWMGGGSTNVQVTLAAAPGGDYAAAGFVGSLIDRGVLRLQADLTTGRVRTG